MKPLKQWMLAFVAILGLAGLVVTIVAACGAAVGLFFGALFWVLQRILGPVHCEVPEKAVPWICLAIVGCALASALGRRRTS